MTSQKIVQNSPPLTWHEETTWDKVRNRVIKVNPMLADIIDEFNPSSKHTLILANYPYGTNIRDKGKVCFPASSGEVVTLDKHIVPTDIRELLSYSSSPLALILDKRVEVYVETPEGRTIPFKLFHPGTTFGVWEIMKQPPIVLRRGWDWSISSGARTLFMLPKIMDTASHAKLQKAYHTYISVPRNIFEQSKLFTKIYNYSAVENPWYTPILFFTKKWLEPQANNIGWFKLKEYWAKGAWEQALYWTNKMIFDLNWEAYIAELTQRKIKLKPYLLDTVKHLISIGCGVIPGFRAADDSEQVAPTRRLQNAYIGDYSLKTYAPIMMYPEFLGLDCRAVYYSLQFSTLPEKPFEFEIFSSVLKIMRELKVYMDIFLETLEKWSKLQIVQGYDFLENIKFEYFHTELDEHRGIQHASTIPKLDHTFLSAYPKKYGKLQFPGNSPFFRGCICISSKVSSLNK